MANFCVEVFQTSLLWKLALLFGLCGIGCCAAGLCTPNFVSSSRVNGTDNLKWGLFEYCAVPYDGDDWVCEMYPRSQEPIYLLVSRYIAVAAVVCGLFGAGSHFFSPLHRPACRVKYSIYYYGVAVVTGIVGSVVFVCYKVDEADTWGYAEPKPFTVDISWSFYLYIAACVIYVVAAIFCFLEERRVHSPRTQGESYSLATTT